MRTRGTLIVASIAIAIAVVACSTEDAPVTTRCDPGSVVFCRCADGEAGSHTCSDDGESFGDCTTQTDGSLCPASQSTGGAGGASASTSATATATATASASSTATTSATASGSGGGGGGGGAALSGCPGVDASVGLGADVTVSGDTSLASDTLTGPCGGAGAGEIVYRVTPASSGTLVATVTGVAIDAVLYAIAIDCATGPFDGCVDATGAGGMEALDVEAVAGTPIWIVVDSKSGASGAFTLNLHVDASVAGDTCPGIAVAIDVGQSLTAWGDTSIASASYKGTGACAASASTKDIVYAVTPSADGMLTVTLDPSYDGELYARSGACTTGAQIACSEIAGVGGEESIAFAVTSGTKYSVFVDGNAGSAGSYTARFELQ